MIAATVSGGGLGDRLRAAGERFEAKLAANVKAFGSAVLADLIAETPKLTGQATANWQVSLGTANDVFIQLDRHGDARFRYDAAAVGDALEYGTSVIEEFELGATLVIFNNAPYIVALNEGRSSKAPAGFVQSILAKHSALLTETLL